VSSSVIENFRNFWQRTANRVDNRLILLESAGCVIFKKVGRTIGAHRANALARGQLPLALADKL
jgi:hypothetical protein